VNYDYFPQIIFEANTFVPNECTNTDRVSWLNNINQDFFNFVKITKIFVNKSIS